jgi:hypothetical protein
MAEERMTGHLGQGDWLTRWGAVLAGMACLLLPGGCASKATPLPVVSVKGKIVCQGKAVPTVLVKFWPQHADVQKKPVETASGAMGEFVLSCPAGVYRVTVVNIPGITSAPGLEEKSGGAKPAGTPVVSVPARYGDRMSTPWTVEVPEGGKDNLVLTIDR